MNKHINTLILLFLVFNIQAIDFKKDIESENVAWELLRNNLKIKSVGDLKNYPTVYQFTPSLDIASQREYATVKPVYKPTDLADAIELLIKANVNTNSYSSDLVLLTRQALANLAITVQERMVEAYKNNNVRKFVKHAADFFEIAEDIDVLTASKITTSDLPKWQQFIELQKQSLLSGKPIDENKLNSWSTEFENNKEINKQTKPRILLPSNTIETAVLLFEKYKIHLISDYYALK